MGARQKLNEAAYFLSAIERTRQNREEFDFNLSAFLSALSSVFDVMLFDFSEKYSLGFTRNDRLDDNGFEIAARARAKILKQSDALDFLKWWREQLGRLLKGPYGPLHRKRIQIVHKGYLDMERRYVVQLSEIVNVSGGTGVLWQGAVMAGTENRLEPQNVVPRAAHDTRFEIYFQDLPERSAIDVCNHAFHEMENLVASAEREVWTKPPRLAG